MRSYNRGEEDFRWPDNPGDLGSKKWWTKPLRKLLKPRIIEGAPRRLAEFIRRRRGIGVVQPPLKTGKSHWRQWFRENLQSTPFGTSLDEVVVGAAEHIERAVEGLGATVWDRDSGVWFGLLDSPGHVKWAEGRTPSLQTQVLLEHKLVNLAISGKREALTFEGKGLVSGSRRRVIDRRSRFLPLLTHELGHLYLEKSLQKAGLSQQDIAYKILGDLNLVYEIEKEAWKRAENIIPGLARTKEFLHTKRRALASYRVGRIKFNRDLEEGLVERLRWEHENLRLEIPEGADQEKYFRGTARKMVRQHQRFVREMEQRILNGESLRDIIGSMTEKYGEMAEEARLYKSVGVATIEEMLGYLEGAGVNIGAVAGSGGKRSRVARNIITKKMATPLGWRGLLAVGLGGLGVAAGIQVASLSKDPKDATKYGLVFSTGAALGSEYLLNRTFPRGTRTAIFIGAASAVGIAANLMRKEDPAISVLSYGLAGAAGLAASQYTMSAMPKIDMSFGAFLERHGKDQWYRSLQKTLEKTRKLNPILRNFLSTETLGIGAALFTIPVAHNLITKAIGIWKSKQKEKGEEVHHVGYQENIAGADTYSRSEVFQVHNDAREADLVVTGGISTYYDDKRAIEELDRR